MPRRLNTRPLPRQLVTSQQVEEKTPPSKPPRREKGDLAVGRGTVADVAEAHQGLLEAEVLLKRSKMPVKSNPQILALERRLGEVERKLDELLKQRGEGRR